MKSSLHSLIPFLQFLLSYSANCQLRRSDSNLLLSSSYSGRLASRNSTQFDLTLLYNHFARATQKRLPLYCWKSVLTALLHSNGIFSIVACVFVAARMCLPSRCLAIYVYSDFTIPAFGRHVTILSKLIDVLEKYFFFGLYMTHKYTGHWNNQIRTHFHIVI
jgi:hypothetical protein